MAWALLFQGAPTGRVGPKESIFMTRTAPLALSTLALALVWLLPAAPAHAGCGCDHPPPDWSVVMPPFGSPNKQIEIFAVDGAFTVGASYSVDFGRGFVATAQATLTDRLEVSVPLGAKPGPVALEVAGEGYQHQYPADAFTVLSNPRRIRNKEGVFTARSYKAAVTSDGTLLLPVDVSRVKDGMQFGFAFRDLPLAFGPENVVIYNADGVNLTLFTLDVNSTSKQWGDYYGWTVESDAGISGDYYEGMQEESDDISRASDLFTYWRHEFHTYAEAHAPGGSHEVGANGLHPDGTLHIDHSNLVIAIRGLERDPFHPGDPSRALPLEPGSVRVKIGWISILSEAPVDLSHVAGVIGDTDDDWAEELEEVLFEEHDD